MTDFVQFEDLKWKSALRYEDWYIRLEKDIRKILATDVDVKSQSSNPKKAYSLIERMLYRGDIPLATKGPNFDKGRKAIDTAVIHHSSFPVRNPNMLSAVGFLRQYAWDYLNGNILEYNLRGKAVWSGHFLSRKQVFFAYHWLITSKGELVRLLKDEYIGWHAGNWDINTRSVGIVLSGDFEKRAPSKIQLLSLSNLLRNNYPQIVNNRILKHSDIVSTLCPGKKLVRVWEGNKFKY